MNNDEKKENVVVQEQQGSESGNSPVESSAPPTVDQNSDGIKKESNKKLVEPQKDGSNLTEDEKLLVSTGSSVNLVPQKSQAEVKKEEKKFSFSVTSIVSLLLLVVLSLGIVFFNIISRQQLNAAKTRLSNRERELSAYTDNIIANEEILQRVDLYRFLERGLFSPKEIFEYIQNIVNRSGNITIRNISLGNDLSFEMRGSTTDLGVVSRLWYLLGIDPNIETINLESVGKSEAGASFSFRGQLRVANFIGRGGDGTEED